MSGSELTGGSRNTEAGRIVEKKITINAPAEHVWKALTEAEQITRWFSTEAESSPGPGGEIMLSWGEDFSGINDIKVWEPPTHLRTTERREKRKVADSEIAPGGNTPATVPLSVDYYLKSEGGKTVLRLVHSGFGEGDAWDDEYDSIYRGWGICLLNLKKMLELHPHSRSHHQYKQFFGPNSVKQTWHYLLPALGLQNDAQHGLPVSPHFSSMKGAVDLVVPGKDIGLALGPEARFLVRISLYPTPDGVMAAGSMLGYELDDVLFNKECSSLVEVLRESTGIGDN